MRLNTIGVAFLIALILVGLQVLIACCVILILPDWTTRAQFGDMCGAVNVVFSGLALAGVICAILLQREDLEIQRQELALTRTELKRGAAAQERSEKSLTEQARAAEQSAQLSTVKYLLEYYENELSAYTNMTFATTDPRLRRKNELVGKQQKLLGLLDQIFEEVTSLQTS